MDHQTLMIRIIDPSDKFSRIVLFILFLQPFFNFSLEYFIPMIPYTINHPSQVADQYSNSNPKKNGIEQRQHNYNNTKIHHNNRNDNQH